MPSDGRENPLIPADMAVNVSFLMRWHSQMMTWHATLSSSSFLSPPFSLFLLQLGILRT